jgi:hypothetical protein
MVLHLYYMHSVTDLWILFTVGIPDICNHNKSYSDIIYLSCTHSWLITECVGRLTRYASPVEQTLFTLPEHLSSPPIVSGVRVTRSLVLHICFVDRCLSHCTFYFGNCLICSSSIYGFWLSLWYLQTLLNRVNVIASIFTLTVHTWHLSVCVCNIFFLFSICEISEYSN